MIARRLTRPLFILLIVYVLLVGATYTGILTPTLRWIDVGIVAGVLVVWAWSQRRWRWQRTPLDLAIVVWIAAFALSLLTNLNSWRRIALGLWFMGVYIGAWYLLAQALANRALRRTWLIDALLIAGVPVVFVGFAQVWLALISGLPLPRPVGTLGNANTLAALLVMLIPFTAGRLAESRTPLPRVLLASVHARQSGAAGVNLLARRLDRRRRWAGGLGRAALSDPPALGCSCPTPKSRTDHAGANRGSRRVRSCSSTRSASAGAGLICARGSTRRRWNCSLSAR